MSEGKPKRPPRKVLTVRAHETAKDALERIAAARSVATGRKFTPSDAHREALMEYAKKYDPALQKGRGRR